MFEVEVKYRVSDVSKLDHSLRQLTGQAGELWSEAVWEEDSFFQHPVRDFTQTDECLRLRKRTFADGTQKYFLTYKGPKIDTKTKTRKEIEMPIANPDELEQIFEALNFRKAAHVQKIRRSMKWNVADRHIEIVLDTLPDLPEKERTFIELEIITNEKDLPFCRTLVLNLAAQLGLSESIQASYLKLVQSRCS